MRDATASFPTRSRARARWAARRRPPGCSGGGGEPPQARPPMPSAATCSSRQRAMPSTTRGRSSPGSRRRAWPVRFRSHAGSRDIPDRSRSGASSRTRARSWVGKSAEAHGSSSEGSTRSWTSRDKCGGCIAPTQLGPSRLARGGRVARGRLIGLRFPDAVDPDSPALGGFGGVLRAAYRNRGCGAVPEIVPCSLELSGGPLTAPGSSNHAEQYAPRGYAGPFNFRSRRRPLSAREPRFAIEWVIGSPADDLAALPKRYRSLERLGPCRRLDSRPTEGPRCDMWMTTCCRLDGSRGSRLSVGAPSGALRRSTVPRRRWISSPATVATAWAMNPPTSLPGFASWSCRSTRSAKCSRLTTRQLPAGSPAPGRRIEARTYRLQRVLHHVTSSRRENPSGGRAARP